MHERLKVKLITVFWTIFCTMIFIFHCLKSKNQTTECTFRTMKYRLAVVQKQFRPYLLFLYVSFYVTFVRKDNSFRIIRLVGLLENWVTR